MLENLSDTIVDFGRALQVLGSTDLPSNLLTLFALEC